MMRNTTFTSSMMVLNSDRYHAPTHLPPRPKGECYCILRSSCWVSPGSVRLYVFQQNFTFPADPGMAGWNFSTYHHLQHGSSWTTMFLASSREIQSVTLQYQYQGFIECNHSSCDGQHERETLIHVCSHFQSHLWSHSFSLNMCTNILKIY